VPIRTTLREYKLECLACDTRVHRLVWDYDLEKQTCEQCQGPLTIYSHACRPTPGIATDDIPGGVDIHHGICNPDGTPKRYYSKTEIRRACNEQGWTMNGDTPKAYRVHWSGKTTDKW
jgi:hypothetical protein